MKKSELKQIIRECIEEIENKKVEPKIRHKWYADYHEIPEHHHEVDLIDHGYDYVGNRGGLRYMGVSGTKSKKKIGQYLKSKEKHLANNGFEKFK